MSKRVAFAIIAFIIIVGGAFYATRLKGKTESYENQLIATEKKTEKLYIDTDNDGLKDWEEDLWKTGVDRPDTDNDGTNDFEEIRLGRNPLIKSPNDMLGEETLKERVNPTIESDLNETSKFSRELFATYITAKQSGDYKSAGYSDLLIETIEKLGNDNVIIYKDSDFKVINTDKKNLREYGNFLGKMMKEKSKKYPENELIILNEAVTKDDEKKLADLDIPIKRYSEIREEMLKMNVPKDVVSIHAQIVNLAGIMISGIESMKLTIKNPVKAMSDSSLYPRAANYLVKSFEELKKQFINFEVRFNDTEDGYDLINGV